MKILRQIKVPTGDILVVQGEKGKLEMLSIGDYGKDVNLKCDAMGLSRDIEQVKHTKMLPLEEKWVITISTQYGCFMGCEFCDVPHVGPGKNATVSDLVGQIITGLNVHPEVKHTNRLNIHYARMGEPTWNPNVIEATERIYAINDAYRLHPVVSTMMPNKNKWLRSFIHTWMSMKNDLFQGNAGLQLSINSTCEQERYEMFSGNACSLSAIQDIMWNVPKPKGRKITLNFAVAGYEINPNKLLEFFDPQHYIIKLTPMHKTIEALKNGIETEGDYTQFYPYQELEEKLKAVGYDVLVFIASEEEDLGRITCGNAILSGTKPEIPYEEVDPPSQ